MIYRSEKQWRFCGEQCEFNQNNWDIIGKDWYNKKWYINHKSIQVHTYLIWVGMADPR
jgi:hypothetical protein